MIELPSAGLTGCFGLGVAGNFAGHLEQAGEAGDFARVDAPAEAPKGIFPWYLPGDSGFLGAFPLSPDRIELPQSDDRLDLQIEPEAGVLFAVDYSGGTAQRIAPLALAAFNDCSIRREGAKKISEKKNWGACSKGLAARAFEISELDPGGATASLRLASFLRRGDSCHAYGIDSALPGYSYYGEMLTDWIVERLQNQTGGDTPLEAVGEQLAGCGSPARILVGIGATRYTQFGETHFLAPGDESVVVVYDSNVSAPEVVEAAVASHGEDQLEEASVLVQAVRTR
ncbi:MAG: DUF5718 family protein [Solirubrobacterales bacterium]